MQWDDTYELVLRSYADLLDEGEELAPEAPLVSLGIDSLMLVQLVVELEAQYDTCFPDEIFVEETFATVGTLWSAVASEVRPSR